MGYYDNSEEYDKRGIDYDLAACLDYNGQSYFNVDDIERVLAVIEGERDGAAWHWILELKKTAANYSKGPYVYLVGWCDYTGWDCQSGASSDLFYTAQKACEAAGSQRDEWIPFNSTKEELFPVLLKQVEENKKTQTWRQIKDDELKINSLPIIGEFPKPNKD